MSTRIVMSDAEVADAVISFRAVEGRDPRTNGPGQLERYLARRVRSLAPEHAARVGTKPDTSVQRAEAVVRFTREHGHTPRMNATDDAEATLGQWLITYARRKHRQGKLPDRVASVLSSCEGALDSRETPDQDAMMDALRAFIDEHKRLPRQRVAAEKPLAVWVYGQRPESRKPGDDAYERCVAVQKMIAPYRGNRGNAGREERIAAVRAYVDEHGHLPKSTVVAGVEDAFPGVQTYAEHQRIQKQERKLSELIAYIDEKGMLPPTDVSSPLYDVILRARRGTDAFSERVQAAIEGVPPRSRPHIERRFGKDRLEDLRAFIAEHGVLPGPSSDGNLYRWMYYTSRKNSDIAQTVREIIAETPANPRGRRRRE